MKFILTFVLLIYLIFLNVHSFAKETSNGENILKIGLILPLSGKYQEIGKSVLNSVRLALSKINDNKIENQWFESPICNFYARKIVQNHLNYRGSGISDISKCPQILLRLSK